MGLYEDELRKAQLRKAQNDAMMQAQQAQDDYNSRLAAANSAAASAQSKKVNPLESVLSGIGNSVANLGKGLVNMFGETGASARDLITGNAANEKYTSAFRDWAKKNLYGNENMSDKDYYAKSAGTSLDAAATLSDFIPGVGAAAKTGLNVAQGVGSGIAQQYIDNGANVSLEDALRGGLVGGASAGVGQFVGGKLAGKTAGKGIVSKALNSNIGRGALTGAASGAAGAGLNTALQGGNFGEIMSSAAQGASGGALGGGAMAGAMGLVGTGLEKLNNRVTGAGTPSSKTAKSTTASIEADTPIARKIAQGIADDESIASRVARTVDDVQPVKKSIPITDYDAGEQRVRVNRPDTEYSLGNRQGSNIDGILSPNNRRQLANADVDTTSRFQRLFNDKNIADAYDALQSGQFGDDASAVLRDILSDETYNKLRDTTRDYAQLGELAFDGTTAGNKSELPKLNREQYYEDTIGKLGKKGNAGLRAADVPDYMYDHLDNSAGKNNLGRMVSDNESILREFFGDDANNLDLTDMYKRYEDLAQAANQNAVYTNDNALGALAMDPDLNRRVTQEILEDSYPTRKIDVKSAPSISQSVDVDSYGDTTPIRRTLNQAQEVAQDTTPRRVIRRSADTSGLQIDPNLDPSEVAALERQITVNRQKQGAALLEQYGTLNEPTRRALGSPEDVLATLYDEYGLKTPADVQYAANHVTGKDGTVTKMTRELAKSADNVDTVITEDWLSNLMKENGLLEDEKKIVHDQVAAALQRAGRETDGNTTLDIMKQLEKQSARYKGKDGTYHLSTDADQRKGLIIDIVHDELQDRLWDAAGDPQKVMTPKRLTELKNMYKNNDAWANFVDNKLAKAQSGAELRSAMKPLVDGSKIVYGSKQAAGGYADRAYKAATSANPAVALGQMAYEAALGSDAAKQTKANRYAKKAAQAQAKLTGQTANTTGNGIVNGAKNIASKAGKKLSGVTNMLNNDFLTNRAFGGSDLDMPNFGQLVTRQTARQAGLAQARNQDAERDYQGAVQDAQNAALDFNNAMTEAQQNYANAQAMQAAQAQPSQLDRIGSAMNAALAAGDIDAYGQLADLYTQAYKIYELQNPKATSSSSSDAKALSANQSKALTGLQQLQTLSGMTPDLGTALSSSPLGGLVDMFGGNDYANQAKSLALTLGYLQSGANITPREAENIGKSYIPNAYDSESVRQNKLSRAEQLLRNYLADTGSLTTLQ